ncbi:LuxR C-terminal-related transcriptional regulator [Actinoplanes sp. NPDC048791]|uniref:LuxR C-terminal-related transcriptional regulator n=1 Tax=Actinoplanes sp. NPDC048791 TaxID=3154623 RepID=UPI0033D49C22
MAELPDGGFATVSEISQIASAPGTVEQRAGAVLDALHRLVPFQAAVIYLLDPDRRAAVPVVSRGYDRAVSEYLTSPANTEEIELLGLTRNHAALRLRDLPVPVERVRGWVEHLRPAGFREGLGVGLFTPEGRHLGILGLNTDTERHPTEAARDLIAILAPSIAKAVDPTRSLAGMARIINPALAGILLTRAGSTLPLTGLPGHPLLDAGSTVLAVAARQLTAGGGYGSFLCPGAAHDPANSHVRITMLACPPETPQYVAAVVLLSPPGDLYGLTGRELEILGLIVEGWSNRRIAAALFIAERTVAAHVEHVLAKLGASTRTLAAVRAFRLGLFVPLALAVV